MGLGLESAIHTACSGMKASEKTINVSGNNLSNANTIGYKAERADFASFISYTYNYGTAPGMGFSAGTNPTQIGMGVSLAGVTTNFTQGSFKEGMTRSDIAINGNGFIIVQQEGNPNLNYYTRNGALKLNSDLVLTTNTNMYVMGYPINDKFQIQYGTLSYLKIPVGEMHIAEQTSMVTIEGILNAVGDSSTQGTVLQTPPMTDLAKSAPVVTTPVSITQLPRPLVEGTTSATGGTAGGTMTAGDYLYRLVFVDANGVESDFSAPVNAVVQSGEDSITLDNLPGIPAGYDALRIYRAVDPGDPTQTPEFYHVADWTAGTAYTDIGVTDTTRRLDQSRLGESHQYSYQYYITYTDAFGNESRPVAMGDPYNINNGQAVLSNLPTADPADDWIARKIYRSSGSDPTEIHLIGEINNMDPSATFIDRMSDARLMQQPAVSEAGQGDVLVNPSTLLVDVGKFVNGQFVNVFETGTLTLTPQKGTQELRATAFEITNSTTVGDYLNFLNEAFGIRSAHDGAPLDQGALGRTINSGSPGAAVIDGAFYMLGNAGTANALAFDSNDMHLQTASGQIKLIDLGWGQDPANKQDALGAGVKTDLQVFDSLGAPITVQLTFVLESKSNTETIYRWFADSSENQPVDGSAIATGSGILRFDQHGRLIEASSTTIAVERTQVASVSPLDFEFQMDIGALMALATSTPTVQQTYQDGAGAGTLYDFSITPNGIIMGRFTSGAERPLGQIPLATFRNQEGLYKAGDSLYLASMNSGDAMINIAGSNTGGVGVFKSNSLELSNTDMGDEVVNMILASAMYRANAKVMTTSNEMFDALLRII
jgi:flagellar hook protein FlgE